MWPRELREIPELTRRVARSAFPRGTAAMRIRDSLGPIFEDAQFTDLFAKRGHPALSPSRLALVCVLQFTENLTDRQAADAVRARVDWKYALGLELDDPGFDASVLCEFRTRLLEDESAERLLDLLLARLREVGLLGGGGRARTDSTRVLAACRTLNRLELVTETMRAALESLAVAAPQWLTALAPEEWFDRYERRVDAFRLPVGDAARTEYAMTIGADGFALLAAVYSPDAPGWLRELPGVDVLRRIWVQHYTVEDDQVRWRQDKQLPPGRVLIRSPFDPEARASMKRGSRWTGYKVHLTETCEPDAPHVITHVATTESTTTDVEATADVHVGLDERDLLPEVHLVDTGYTSADLLVSARRDFGLELLGPVHLPTTRQAKENAGFDLPNFTIDWENQQVTCPKGAKSTRWHPAVRGGYPVIETSFHKRDCGPCPVRLQCTDSPARGMSFHIREHHEALMKARADQSTDEWYQRYKHRAGIEGTVAQAVTRCGMRRTRYPGLRKTHLQHVLTACAINLVRTDAWQTGTPLGATRVSQFTRLRPPAAIP
ncbi:IS1182 family transposase [Streptomyces sp. NBC_00365]|uniref:IS1182 family transposase n=1 Tax=Streptomyces sp. NBC_00365 TaxID=2975726 RepID=UPI0022527F8F|nr:IS1182 family transposase [Streptomyces sp. NBC_00365]MCX5095932.1 IS1182 family transposase [Streptomyces sp. NBC_00365]